MMEARHFETLVGGRFDPELPTARDVLMAISCVATQYALNPSLHLARLALSLASNLQAPEYAEDDMVAEVAQRLTAQWDRVVEEYLVVEANVMQSHHLLQ